ncbi:hypothetical protein EYF80_000350 [Liparis tanakae]|uniref:Uncharacterized protein n=1 Tax=Liparis tanakae TaxID=230148 RepID=A0A4Z2JII2_9TELE|nr:hypothetical protein EYF80_000350 [Liparis tanakae]
MSLRRLESIIQPDWPALLEGMILACPAPYITVAQGHLPSDAPQASEHGLGDLAMCPASIIHNQSTPVPLQHYATVSIIVTNTSIKCFMVSSYDTVGSSALRGKLIAGGLAISTAHQSTTTHYM